MDYDGPGPSMTKPPPRLIIDAKNNQPLWIRIRDILLTLLMWCIYLYLMEDFYRFVVTIFDWEVLGIRRPDLPKAFKIMKTMEWYFLIIVVNGLLLLGWGTYNQVRFRGKERRKPRISIDTAELEVLYQVPADEIARWQRSRILTIYHDANGTITRVDTL